MEMLHLNDLHKTFNPGTVNEKVALNGVSLHTRADSERVHRDSEEIKNRFPEEKKQNRGENDTDRHAAGKGPLHPRLNLFREREENRENEERGEQKEKLDINRDGG